MKSLKILLVGQPNTGKSSLLNSLVGPRAVISNYPGTTVELIKAERVFGDTEVNFVDTPGVYSISDRSEEEKITEKTLFQKELDGAVLIADATSLERSLYLVLQILEAGIPAIIALNFVEEAEKKGIKVDVEKLEKLLGVPVIPINPLTKKGQRELVKEILQIKNRREGSFKIKYDDHIEKAIKKISSGIKNNLPKRFIAIRVLEEDEDFYGCLRDKKIIKETRDNLVEHPEIAKDISVTRYGTASFIVEKVIQIIYLDKKKKIVQKFDQIFLHKVWGPIITGTSLLFIFGLLLCLGNWIQNLLMGWTETFLSLFNNTQSLFFIILIQGLTGLVAGISIALPYVLLFYLILGLLEDIGFLSRLIVNVERFFKKLALPGKSFIPLALGLGCSVSAIRSTRILSTKKEQFYTASLLSFVPCSSRMAIIMGVVGFYGGVGLAFFVFVTLLIAGLIWALGVKKFAHVKNELLLLELPPYRKPLIKNILVKSWLRMKDFVYVVIPLLIVGGVTYGILEATGITASVIKPLSPLALWLGLPAVAVIPLVFGFLQKDLVGAMLISVLGNGAVLALTSLQLYVFGVASVIGIPCVIALGVLIREFGWKKALALTLGSIIYGLLIAGLMSKLILLV
jgi:ferrous iron transport protein B